MSIHYISVSSDGRDSVSSTKAASKRPGEQDSVLSPDGVTSPRLSSELQSPRGKSPRFCEPEDTKSPPSEQHSRTEAAKSPQSHGRVSVSPRPSRNAENLRSAPGESTKSPQIHSRRQSAPDQPRSPRPSSGQPRESLKSLGQPRESLKSPRPNSSRKSLNSPRPVSVQSSPRPSRPSSARSRFTTGSSFTGEFDDLPDDGDDTKEQIRRYVLSRRIFQLARKFYWTSRENAPKKAPRLPHALKAVYSSSRTIMALDSFLKVWYQEQLDLKEEIEEEKRRELELQWEDMKTWLANVTEDVSGGLGERVDLVLTSIGTDFSDLREKSFELSHECTVLARELRSLLNHSFAMLEGNENLKAELSETTALVRLLLGDFVQRVQQVKDMISDYDSSLVDGSGGEEGKKLQAEKRRALVQQLDNITAFAEDSMVVKSESKISLLDEDAPSPRNDPLMSNSPTEDGRQDSKQVTFDVAPVKTEFGETLELSGSCSSAEIPSEEQSPLQSPRSSLHSTRKLIVEEDPLPVERFEQHEVQLPKRPFFHMETWEDVNLREAVLHMRWRTTSPTRSPTVSSVRTSPSPFHPLYHSPLYSEHPKLPSIASTYPQAAVAPGIRFRPRSLKQAPTTLLSLQAPAVLPPISRPRKKCHNASPAVARSGKYSGQSPGLRFQAVGSSCIDRRFRVFKLSDA